VDNFNGKQHISFVISFIVVLYLPEPQDDLYFVLGALLGCLLPDTDHKNSIAGHVIPLWLVFKHGKETHTILANSIFVALYFFTKNDVWYGVALGYASHLITDNLDGNNLKYLYAPFKRTKKEVEKEVKKEVKKKQKK